MVGYFRLLYQGFIANILAIPGRTIALVLGVFLFFIPVFTTESYILRILIISAIYAIFAMSWDFLAGFSGQLNLGQSFFFGVSSYIVALLNLKFGLPPWATIPIGAMASMVAGLIICMPALRVRGFYLALCTLVFPIILTGLIYSFPDFTGGEQGLFGIERLAANRVSIYYLINIIMLGSALIMWKLTDVSSKIIRTGVIFQAICEDEITARASAINTTFYKILAFAISGLFAGVAGGLYTHFVRVAGPSSLDIFLSFQAILWTIFGGMRTIYGPVFGVYILYPLVNFLGFSSIGAEVKYIVFALLLIIILLFMPKGITVWIREAIEEKCPRCMETNIATRRFCRACRAPLNIDNTQ
jgi:branched-chain amino acid transport system permease protein